MLPQPQSLDWWLSHPSPAMWAFTTQQQVPALFLMPARRLKLFNSKGASEMKKLYSISLARRRKLRIDKSFWNS